MAKAVVMYNPPVDANAFDTYYANVHLPLAKKMPGLRSLEVSNGAIGSPAGPAPYHVVAIMSFDSMADLQAALGSPEGQAAVADLPKFASGGVTMMMYDHQTV